ncbi:MAG: hypothetical protein HKUEN01_34370 [Candidatus Kuenenia stuttgartiensis]|nr:MAG: hypothetical protein HKUEN01_34370 [Candidatus Kuenenia stuttgartiensis]
MLTTMLIFDFTAISPNKRLIDKPRHTPLSDNILIKTGIKSSCIWQQFYSVVDVNRDACNASLQDIEIPKK